VALLRDQWWEVITQEDEDQARRLLREHRDGPPPRTRMPAAMPEVSLPDDARFVLRAEHVLRQAGWHGEPFLGVKLVDPTWARARWDRAQAALAGRGAAWRHWRRAGRTSGLSRARRWTTPDRCARQSSGVVDGQTTRPRTRRRSAHIAPRDQGKGHTPLAQGGGTTTAGEGGPEGSRSGVFGRPPGATARPASTHAATYKVYRKNASTIQVLEGRGRYRK
jgi:hypothetical protein